MDRPQPANDSPAAPATEPQAARSWRSWLRAQTDPRVWGRSILMLDDTPHSIALGTAIGIFVGLTPTVGIQMVIVLAIAFLTRRVFHFNRVAALIAVYISNPVTTVPMYWFNYRIGTLFFRHSISYENFADLVHYRSLADSWTSLRALFMQVGPALLVGSLIVATLGSLACYFPIRKLVEEVQLHHRHKKPHDSASC